MEISIVTAKSSLETGEPVPLAWQGDMTSRGQTFHVKSGQIIISQGATSTDVFYIMQGEVQFSLISENGRESILRNLGPGHIFGELSAFDAHLRSVSVTAIKCGKFVRLSKDEFLDFLACTPPAALWMNRQMTSRIRSLTERVFQLSTMSVSSRVQNELLRLGEEDGVKDDQACIRDFPTHAKIAAKLGTHREAVTKELRLLAKEGIAKQSGRMLRILSVRRLQALLSRTLQ